MYGANYIEEQQKNTFFSRANIRVFKMVCFSKHQSSFDETTRKLFRATEADVQLNWCISAPRTAPKTHAKQINPFNHSNTPCT